MCEPTTLTVASLALVAAGTAATAYGAKQADKAEGAATSAELDRQAKLRREADAVHGNTISANGAKKTIQHMDEAAGKRTAAYQQSVADTASFAPLGVSTTATGTGGNQVVADAYRKEQQGASSYVQQQGQAQSALQAFDDTMQNNAIFNANQGYDIRKLGSFMQGSANVLPYELDSAGHKGDTSKTIGGILQALGAVTGAGSAVGAVGATAGAASQANANQARANTKIR